ncbi:hypothetical protein [Halomicronema sp. CCY15110]|uniref:hypothetical protein n=1 Tax=Halomicronema sp. CCY15110 TaxID=2767773 RepID=UPI0019500CEE|nr:hypothetical protein [Halomicronema sp. CCY15110]
MTLKVRFAGDFVQNNQIPMGILAHTLFYTEKAFERAYLDIERGGIRKNEYMRKEDYRRAILLFEGVQYSSIGFNFNEQSSELITPLNRLKRSFFSQHEKAAKEGEDLELSDVKEQVELTKRIIETNGIQSIQEYSEFVANPGDKIIREFGDRSINKYVDRAINPVRNNEGDNIIEITIKGDETNTFTFNSVIAERFGKIVSHKTLGKPFALTATLVSADNINLKAKIYNTTSKRQMNVFFTVLDDLVDFSPYIGKKSEQFQFIAAPVIESGSYDLSSGDVYFLMFLG